MTRSPIAGVMVFAVLLSPAACKQPPRPAAAEARPPSPRATPVSFDGMLPSRCEVAARIDFGSLWGAFGDQLLPGLAGSPTIRGMDLLRGAGLDVSRDIDVGALCRVTGPKGPLFTARLLGRIPADLLAKVERSSDGRVTLSAIDGALVAYRDNLWIAQKGATELVVSNDEAGLRSVLGGRMGSYPLSSDAMLSFVLGTATLQRIFAPRDGAELSGARAIRTMVVDLGRDRTTVRARLIVGDPAVASQLGVAISQMLTTWNRTQGAGAPLDARTRVEGGDAIAEFRIPASTLTMLAERAGILARQPPGGGAGAPMSQIDPFRRH